MQTWIVKRLAHRKQFKTQCADHKNKELPHKHAFFSTNKSENIK